MESSRRGVLAVLGVLAGLAASGSGYQIVEGPQNITVLKGSEARFNCTVSPGWKLIMWALNGVVVLSVTPREPIITNDRFTSASYDRGGDFVSEMIVHDVQLRDAGQVRCSLQSSDLDALAFLSVQVMGTLSIPGDDLEVTEDEPCNVTCRAQGWTPLPDITWRVGVPASHSSYSSFAEPGAGGGVVSILALRPQGNGTLTCVAALRAPEARTAVTVNLTVVPPSPVWVKEGAVWGSAQVCGTGPCGPALADCHQDLPPSLPPTVCEQYESPVAQAEELQLETGLLVLELELGVAGGSSRGPCLSPESSYQNEIRKSATAKTTRDAVDSKLKRGNENYGYSSDEPKAAQLASLPPKSADLSAVPEPGGSRSPPQDLSKPRPGRAGHPQVSFDIASPRKVRNVTLV
ncbi:PREDICTED: immunoglobulin superfamily member 5 [Dipodomys ordii]|uniref:immunoglobulin superfamily member 5 n=1 Tax=Dipodomys ordii TaxID=10020 RepID=UPI0006511B07|nr:PREDICTED: immunoglobulin superfamily member 5 [Dipodomys ordii]